MNDYERYVDKLVASASSSNEQKNAIALNNYASEQHLSYSLVIRRRNDSSMVRMDELVKALDDELNVAISPGGHDGNTIWTPIDNNNIFVLLCE